MRPFTVQIGGRGQGPTSPRRRPARKRWLSGPVFGLLSVALALWLPSAAAKSRKPSQPTAAPAPAASGGSTGTATTSTPPASGSPGTASSVASPSAAPPAPASTPAPSSAAAATPDSQPAPAAPLAKGEVDAAKTQAASHFQAGRYREAAELLLRVFDADRQPLYLFNAGQAYRKGDLPNEAKATYERFLDVAPNHKLAPEVRGYVKDMDTLLATQKKAKEISLELDKEKADAQFARQALLQERSTPIYKRPLFWGLMGTGLLVVLGGVAVTVATISAGRSDLGTQIVKLPSP